MSDQYHKFEIHKNVLRCFVKCAISMPMHSHVHKTNIGSMLVLYIGGYTVSIININIGIKEPTCGCQNRNRNIIDT